MVDLRLATGCDTGHYLAIGRIYGFEFIAASCGDKFTIDKYTFRERQFLGNGLVIFKR
jgi:hypothetical protein